MDRSNGAPELAHLKAAGRLVARLRLPRSALLQAFATRAGLGARSRPAAQPMAGAAVFGTGGIA